MRASHSGVVFDFAAADPEFGAMQASPNPHPNPHPNPNPDPDPNPNPKPNPNPEFGAMQARELSAHMSDMLRDVPRVELSL